MDVRLTEKDGEAFVKGQNLHQNDDGSGVDKGRRERKVEIDDEKDEWEKQHALRGTKQSPGPVPLFIILTMEKYPIDKLIDTILHSEIEREEARKKCDKGQLRVDDEVGMEVERLIDIVDNAQEHGGLEDEEPLEATLQGRLCHLGHAARHEEEILQLLQEEIFGEGKGKHSQQEAAQQQRGDGVVVAQEIGSRIARHAHPWQSELGWKYFPPWK